MGKDLCRHKAAGFQTRGFCRHSTSSHQNAAHDTPFPHFETTRLKKTCGEKQAPIILTSFAALRSRTFSVAYNLMLLKGWLGSRVVSVLDSGAEGPGFKSQSRRCRVTVSGKLFTPVVHQAAKLVAAFLRVAGVTAGLAESNGSLP